VDFPREEFSATVISLMIATGCTLPAASASVLFARSTIAAQHSHARWDEQIWAVDKDTLVFQSRLS